MAAVRAMMWATEGCEGIVLCGREFMNSLADSSFAEVKAAHFLGKVAGRFLRPEEILRAIGRLRKEARDEIDRLIRFLDETEDHMELEPCNDDGEGRILGSFDRMTDQSKAWQQRSEWAFLACDAEQDDCDREDDDPDEAKQQPWHRRHAIILASQLPEGKEDALLVREATIRLVTLPGFWDGEEAKPTATIVRIGGNECS
jgi:hypothetical protein